ncbi:MAG: protein-glutamate O-methyltransferase CheR [Actinomycetota bacterium]
MNARTTTTNSRAEQGSGISDQAFETLRSLVLDRIGVQLDGKRYLAESRLEPLMRTFETPTIDALMKATRTNTEVAEAVVEAMTTNETSFFRDGHPFEALATTVLPEIFKRNPGARAQIWNAACSSGQESYSLAMTLFEHMGEVANASRVNIMSTDVSKQMVQRTNDAVYSRFEVNRGLSPQMVDKYFDRNGRHWVVKKHLRDLVNASEHNLLGAWHLIPRCDVVLIRNVLIYFSVATKAEILRKIRTEILQPGGYLLLGASESTVGLDDAWEPKKVGESTFYVAPGD